MEKKRTLLLLISIFVYFNGFGFDCSQNTFAEEKKEKEFSKIEYIPKSYVDFVNQLYFVSKSKSEFSPKEIVKGAIKFLPEKKKEVDYWKKIISRNNNPKNSLLINYSERFRYNRYHPVISENGDKLFFCSFNEYGKTGGEDIFVSEKINNSWSFPEVYPYFNTENNEAPNWISENLKDFIIVKFKKKNPRGDLFLVNVDMRSDQHLFLPAPVNTPYFEADGRFYNDNVLVFVSDRPNGIGQFREKGQVFRGDSWGNTDIYISILKDSTWQSAINLGSVINTEMAERTPYITKDGKYLFFSSSGHTGFGGLDIFVSKRLSDTSWTEWSEPINLGPFVNSPDDDWGFMLTGDEKTAYFSNTKDIFSCQIPNDFYNFDNEYCLTGKVKDELSNLISSDIKLTNLETGFTEQITSSSINGKYSFTIDPYCEYKLTTSKEHYNPDEQVVSFLNDTSSVIIKDITLISQKEVKIDTTDNVITVFFEFNKFSLDKAFEPKLDFVAKLLKEQSENSEVSFEIGGYTDGVGSVSYNKKLSLKRANTVFAELKERGLQDELFDLKAYGKANPIASNNTDEGRAKNRRVVLKIIKQKQ